MDKITLRRATLADLPQLQIVEEGATPGLNYLADVFDLFDADDDDDLSVAEIDGKVVACGKYSRMPDHSAWLETLRVLPEYQGRGIGKKFYDKFFETANRQNIHTMRMYTGSSNVVSKGLAERYGFRLAETFTITKKVVAPASRPSAEFKPVTSGDAAFALLQPQLHRWGSLICYNRTFFRPVLPVFEKLAKEGLVFSDGKNIVVVGARFQPKLSHFVLTYAGEAARCMDFAVAHTAQAGAKNLICILPHWQKDILCEMTAAGFGMEPHQLIVEEWNR